jgi:hypothetical protein
MTDAVQPANNNCDSTEQTTLLEDSEFMVKIGDLLRTIIRAELSFYVSNNKVKWDIKPKGKPFWNEAVARVKCVITKYGYATNQLLKDKEPWFNKVEFTYSQQMGRLFDKVIEDGEYVRFRLNNGNRAAWYITRIMWQPRARRKALFEKDKNYCEEVTWASEILPVEREAAQRSIIPLETPPNQNQETEVK